MDEANLRERFRGLDFVLDFPGSCDDDAPLVVLLGWFGCKQRWLAKYTDLLAAERCPTVRAIAPPLTVFSPIDYPRRRFAEALLLCIQAVNAGAPSRPVIFYVFSNGGGFILEQVEALLEQKDTQKGSAASSWGNINVAGTIFDSAPCYMHFATGAKAIGEGRTWIVRALLAGLFLISVVIGRSFSSVSPQRFWRAMAGLKNVGQTALYLYSSDDPLCDAVLLDELVRRRKAAGYDARQRCWEESQHVGHLRRHPDEYTQLVLGFLKEMKGRGE